jgi:glucose 1-dehydrogenase
MKGLAGKVALVTGGSSGIGQAIAVRFGQERAHVAINYRKGAQEAERTHALIHHATGQVDETGAKHIVVQADVSKEADILAMFDRVYRELGGLDVLVNNAGFQISTPSHELDAQHFDSVLATNLRGAYLCAREAVRHFLAQAKPGVIINVSSVHQIIPKPKYLGYSVSKGGLQNLTTTLALEYADRDIRVNAVGPGATITPINRAWVDDPEKRAAVESHIPMRRAGTAEEIAAAVAFLASDEATYITGQTLYVDGGLTLYPSFATPWSSE